MKYSKSDLHRKYRNIQELKFEAQNLTSFSGLVIFQKLFNHLDISNKLKRCFDHLSSGSTYSHHKITLLLIVHLLLGYRELRDIRYYDDDPMVKRVLGLFRLPDAATLSRTLAGMDNHSVFKVRILNRRLVLERLSELAPARLTVDFDGSVQSTGKFAEGSAVGFNKKKKGARSYYPLYCTIAQTGQVFDVHHRPGNVHDSNGAREFILECIQQIRSELPGVLIEMRMDSAFFQDELIDQLDEMGIEFTCSVPFERFAQLKGMIEGRKWWRWFNSDWSYFESDWKPKKWSTRYRFIFIRSWSKKQQKSPVQLDIFEPFEYGYEFKVIITNKKVGVKKVLAFHNGRGAQEGIFSELKSQAQMDYVPTRKLAGNQIYLFATILAHNMTRELQMLAHPRKRNTTEKRAALWKFFKIDTIRQTLIQRAGKITKPGGKLTLTMSGNAKVEKEILHYLGILDQVA